MTAQWTSTEIPAPAYHLLVGGVITAIVYSSVMAEDRFFVSLPRFVTGQQKPHCATLREAKALAASLVLEHLREEVWAVEALMHLETEAHSSASPPEGRE
jgi:hypothetical protein